MSVNDWTHVPTCATEEMLAAGRLYSEQAGEVWTAMMAHKPEPDDRTPDDVAVDDFAFALKAKLKQARAKGRGGWQTCPPEELSRMLREHVDKGDPRDVANFCMFLWSLGHGIAAPEAPAQAGGQGQADAVMRDALQSIREHCLVQPSALAKAIVATCDNALSHPEAPKAAGEPVADGRLHADGYFTWNKGKRPAYIADRGLPCDFYLHPPTTPPAQASDAEDAARLNWLDAQNRRFKMGWQVGKAPAGNVSVKSVIFVGQQPVSIRAAIDAARNGEQP